jgi:hypothetical protein
MDEGGAGEGVLAGEDDGEASDPTEGDMGCVEVDRKQWTNMVLVALETDWTRPNQDVMGVELVSDQLATV